MTTLIVVASIVAQLVIGSYVGGRMMGIHCQKPFDSDDWIVAVAGFLGWPLIMPWWLVVQMIRPIILWASNADERARARTKRRAARRETRVKNNAIPRARVMGKKSW